MSGDPKRVGGRPFTPAALMREAFTRSASAFRFAARRDAGLQAEEEFELAEPRLEFEDWVEAGAPERYRAEGPVARAEGLLRRFGSVAG